MNKTPKWLRWLTIARSYEPSKESLALIQSAISEATVVPEDASFVFVTTSNISLKAVSKESLGTMYISINNSRKQIDRIKAFLEIRESGAGKGQVYIYTKLRSEYLLFLAVFGIIGLGLIGSGEVSEGLPILSGIMVVVFIWFRFIYRFQEKRLIYLLEEYFKLVDHEQG